MLLAAEEAAEDAPKPEPVPKLKPVFPDPDDAPNAGVLLPKPPVLLPAICAKLMLYPLSLLVHLSISLSRY